MPRSCVPFGWSTGRDTTFVRLSWSKIGIHTEHASFTASLSPRLLARKPTAPAVRTVQHLQPACRAPSISLFFFPSFFGPCFFPRNSDRGFTGADGRNAWSGGARKYSIVQSMSFLCLLQPEQSSLVSYRWPPPWASAISEKMTGLYQTRLTGKRNLLPFRQSGRN